LRAVNQEQQQAALGLTAADTIKTAGLLGATFAVTGRAVPLDGDRIRLEARLIVVETVETRASATAEGSARKELDALLQRLAEQLTSGGVLGAAETTAPPSPGKAIRPEALIMFYEGLHACASGQPVLGIAFFMNAHGLDDTFDAARTWEVRAYEMAGLMKEAALAAEVFSIRRGFPSGAVKPSHGPARAGKRVVAVLPPAVDGGPGQRGRAAEADPSGLRLLIEKRLVADGGVRVFCPEGIRDAVAEQDAQLGEFFARQHVARYGQWLAVDALLLCRVDHAQGTQWQVRLSAIDPIGATSLADESSTCGTGELPRTVEALAVKAAGEWASRDSGSGATRPAPRPTSAPLTKEDLARLPAHSELAAALDVLSRGAANRGTYKALVDAYNKPGMDRLAALELERLLDGLDPKGSTAEADHYETLLWIHDFFNAGQNKKTCVRFVPDLKLAKLTDVLWARYPDAPSTICAFYFLALEAWRAAHWQETARYAAQAAAAVEKRAARLGTMPEPDSQVAAAACYMQGDSLLHLGLADEARLALTRADKLRRTKMFPTWIRYDGNRTDATLHIFQSCGPALDEAIDLLLRPAPGTDGSRSYAGLRQRLTTELVQKLGRRMPDVATALLKDLTATWAADPDVSRGAEPPCVDVANACLSRLKDDPRAETLAHETASAYAAYSKFSPEAPIATGDVQTLTRRLSTVMSVYQSAAGSRDQVTNAGWARWVCPRFEEPWPPDLGLQILQGLPCLPEPFENALRRLAARAPGYRPCKMAEMWANCVEARFRAGAYDKAMADYREVIRLDPTLSLEGKPGCRSGPLLEARQRLDEIVVEVAFAEAPDTAVQRVNALRGELCPPAERSYPPEMYGWFNVAARHQRRGQHETALVCCERVLELLQDPTQCRRAGERDRILGSTLFYKAKCLAELGRRADAARTCRELSLAYGDAKFEVVSDVTLGGWGFQHVPIGVAAAQLAEMLHADATKADDKSPSQRHQERSQ
jgi:tetratricopeptide (TPR) repeat protein